MMPFGSRLSFAITLLAPSLLFTSQTYMAGSRPGNAARSRPAAARKCDPRRGKGIDTLLPCAWDEARRQMRQKYPPYSNGIGRLDQPVINFRDGEWYDEQLGEYVVGDTDLRDDPPIQVGLTGDAEFDYETTVHEFKHYIVDRLGLGEEAHSWVDEDENQYDEPNRGISSDHRKKRP